MKNLAAPYSSTLLSVVPSAKKDLTSEFGMGSGITPSLLPPEKKSRKIVIRSSLREKGAQKF